MKTLTRFPDKTVAIPGASRGIGRGVASRFAQEGANVVVTANEEKVHGVAKFRGMGHQALFVVCAVTDKLSVGAH